MRIAVIGGGPGGLYFSALAQQLSDQVGTPRDHRLGAQRGRRHVRVRRGVQRRDPRRHRARRPVVHAAMEAEFARWDDIDVHFKGEVVTSGGHGFAAMSASGCSRSCSSGAPTSASTCGSPPPAPDVAELSRDYDLVVACDGLDSAVRTTYADTFRPTLDVRDCKYMWLGTDKVFDAFKFYVERDAVRRDADPRLPVRRARQHLHRGDELDTSGRRPASGRTPGRLAASALRRGLDRAGAVDLPRRARRARGAGRTTRAGSPSPPSATSTGVHGNVVLLGDAAHTAHFSIGSAPSWPWRTRSRWRRACTRSDVAGRGARRLRDRAQGRRALHPAGGAGQPGVVREPRAVRRPGPAAVRVQHHDPQPAGDLRQPAGARPGVRGPARRWFAGRRRGAPADVPAVPARGSGAATTGSSCHRWTCTSRPTGCPTSSTSCTSAARRSAAPAW